MLSLGISFQHYQSQMVCLLRITWSLVSERLISPRIPFIQIRRLRHVHGLHGIYGQIINDTVSVNAMVNYLPKDFDDDYSINVHIKKEKYTYQVIKLGRKI